MLAYATSAQQRTDFYPPRPQGTGRAMGLALVAHLLLAGALTWGVNWKREATVTTVEAELWSALPQQAAPKLIETPSTTPTPAPKPLVVAPEPPPVKAPEIAVEKEKPKPPKAVVKPEPKPEPKPQSKPEPKPQSKTEAKPNKALEDKKLAEQREEAERQKNINRSAGLAGASGVPNASGQAAQSASISASYGARIRSRVLPNHVFTGDTSNNPEVEIEVLLDSTGLIRQRPKIIKSSGNRVFDESVVRAFEETEILPRDENGRVPPRINIVWSAKRN